MDCERVREELATGVALADARTWPESVREHLAACEACRLELEALRQAWTALARWPEVSPAAETKQELRRRVRRQVFKEAVLAARGWTPAIFAAVVGVGLSLGLSLLVPYAVLVTWCQRLLEASDSYPGAFLVAGIAYGAPLALGAWSIGRGVPRGALLRGLEASLLFLLILVPYVIVQCREFAPLLQIVFVSGLGGGAVGSSLAAVALGRWAAFGRFQLLMGGR